MFIFTLKECENPFSAQTSDVPDYMCAKGLAWLSKAWLLCFTNLIKDPPPGKGRDNKKLDQIGRLAK